ncbi:MAG: AraC family transcriptional regulator [Gammaproteobacteria bacterium]|nr:AraC family transcriptional regulator [Gammaproteobacteria bacterium]MBT5725677.1 AraC family transcriptional regulator [Gammaproteobacteria bacterium]MBT6890588.1 AraC family transcriptional regulator [Gammaproteobacteria bacterium]MBT7880255.1 AraC family transcriptional regulator [Gammaproteobacteria bacterium]
MREHESMIAPEYSTIGPIGTVIAQTLQAEGIDPAPLFSKAGIDVTGLSDPRVRMPADSFKKLLELIEETSSDPAIGLTIARFIHPTTFYSLGIAMYCSDTLGQYLDRFIKYYRVVTTNNRLEGKVDADGIYHLRAISSTNQTFPGSREDGIASFVTTILRLALHHELPLISVKLARPTPTGVEGLYEKFFRCSIEFNAEHTELAFQADMLEEELTSANPELAEMYEQLTIEYLDKIDRLDFPSRVTNELIRLLPTGVSAKEKVAEALNISTRTLYNKLEASGTTYRQVLDTTRQQLAEQYIHQGIPIYEIAYLIGFSDTANFSRAFKKWAGVSPMGYRNSILSETQD